MVGPVYLARAMRYMPKMFMKLTTGVNFINILHTFVTYGFSKISKGI